MQDVKCLQNKYSKLNCQGIFTNVNFELKRTVLGILGRTLPWNQWIYVANPKVTPKNVLTKRRKFLIQLENRAQNVLTWNS